MKEKADDVICAITPEPFYAVGRWYQDFSQTADEEVGILLARQGTPETGEVAQGPAVDRPLINALREIAYPLAGSARDYDPLMGRIGEARFVLLGERGAWSPAKRRRLAAPSRTPSRRRRSPRRQIRFW
jgi:hypothetical protein